MAPTQPALNSSLPKAVEAMPSTVLAHKATPVQPVALGACANGQKGNCLTVADE